MEKKINVVHVGVSGIPFGRNAPINRCLAIYSVLNKEEFHVFAINNKATHASSDTLKIDKKGDHSNISYQYTTSPYKSTNFFKRRYYNFIGPLNEFLLILKLGFKKKIDIMLFYPKGTFFELLFYRIVSKLFRFPLVSQYVEYRSSFESRKTKWLKINDTLFDKYFMFFIDGVIPISEFLIDNIKERRNNLPILKIPPLVDFNLFKGININKEKTANFLYVGSAGYYKAIKIILDAFKLVDSSNYHLFLVLHGVGIDTVKKEIETHPKGELIKIFSNLEYKNLVQMYKEANALLIPLSNSIQDKARFPQKISEYLASANPIITTNFGEVKYYFKDNVNALVADQDTPIYLAEKMNFIIENPSLSKKIGEEGYTTGLKYFDNNSYRESIKEFILNLVN